MIRDEYGWRVCYGRVGWCRRRVSQWLPRGRETVLQIRLSHRWYHVQWLPREGYWVTRSGLSGAPVTEYDYYAPRPEGDRMIRRIAAAPGGTILPALPSTSTLMPKLPGLRAFLAETAYDDGSARTPGYVTIRNRAIAYEVTVYDPDSGARLSARGPTLDQALGLVEQLLGVADAPWERDQYLSDQLAKRSKRKRA